MSRSRINKLNRNTKYPQSDPCLCRCPSFSLTERQTHQQSDMRMDHCHSQTHCNSVHLILPPHTNYVPQLPRLILPTLDFHHPTFYATSTDWNGNLNLNIGRDADSDLKCYAPAPVTKDTDWTRRRHQIDTYLSNYIQNPPPLDQPLGLYVDPYVSGQFLQYEPILGFGVGVGGTGSGDDYFGHNHYTGLLFDSSSTKPPTSIVTDEDEGRGSAQSSVDSMYQETEELYHNVNASLKYEHQGSQFQLERYSTYGWTVSWDDILAPFPYRSIEFNCENTRSRDILETQQFISENGPKGPIALNHWKILESNNPDSTISKIKSSYQEPGFVQLSEFISHCLHLMCGRESDSFERDSPGSDEFQWNRRFLVPGISPTTLDNFTVPLLLVGSAFKTLVHKVTERITDSLLAENARNYVYNFVIKTLSRYIEDYESFIMVQGEVVRTLVGLNKLPKVLLPQLYLLHEIIVLADTIPTLEFIGTLFSMFNTVKHPTLKDLIEGIYKEAVVGYMRHISDWTFRGLLGSGEFHIGINDAELADPRYTNNNTRSHWMRLYEEKDQKPRFLSQTLLDLILETGKSIALFQSATAKQDSAKQLYRKYNFQLEPFVSLGLCSNFNDLLDLDAKYLDLSSKFHASTHSTFQSEIQNELKNVLRCSVYDIPMDFSQISRVRLEYKLSHPESSKELYRRRNDMYRILKIYRVERQGKQPGRNRSNSLEDISLPKQASEFQLSDSRSEPGPVPLDRRLSRSNIDIPQLELQKEQEVFESPYITSPNPYLRSHQDSHQIASSLNYSSHPDPYVSPRKARPLPLPDNLPFTIGRKSMGQKTKKKIPTSMREVLIGYDQEEQKMENTEGQDEVALDPDRFTSLTRSEPYEEPSFEIFWKPFVTVGVESGQLPCQTTSVPSSKSADESCLINYFVAESISIPLTVQYKMVNSSILHYLIVEEKLFAHLGRINDYLFLHNGVFGQSLGNLLIQEVKSLGLRSLDDLTRRSRSGRLKEILNESFYEGTGCDELSTKSLMEFFEFTYIGPGASEISELRNLESEQRKIPSIYQVLNSVGLKYSLSWPLNLILTREIVSFAESTFNLLFQLQRVQLLLEGIYSDYKSKQKDWKLEKIFRYRHRFLHFVSTLRTYLSGTIIDPAWKQLLHSLSIEKNNNLEEIYHKIINYINTISRNCLLGPSSTSGKSQGILKIVMRALLVIESFCSKLQVLLTKAKGGHPLISDRELKNLRIKFDVVEGYQETFVKVLIDMSVKFPYRNEHVISLIQSLDFNHYFEERIWGPGGWAPGKPNILAQRMDQ